MTPDLWLISLKNVTMDNNGDSFEMSLCLLQHMDISSLKNNIQSVCQEQHPVCLSSFVSFHQLVTELQCWLVFIFDMYKYIRRVAAHISWFSFLVFGLKWKIFPDRRI